MRAYLTVTFTAPAGITLSGRTWSEYQGYQDAATRDAVANRYSHELAHGRCDWGSTVTGLVIH